jgi:hypothetical protein
MLDGSSLGTLILGLEVGRRASDTSEPTVRRSVRPSRPAPSRVRVPLAIALRSVANRLDRTASAGLGSSGSAA